MFHILRIIVITLGLFCSPTGMYSLTSTSGDFHQEVKVLKVDKNYRAWQGVASDGTNIYITSDRDENFKLSNTISTYTMDGSFVTEKTNAYTETDQKGLFMSFGDCYITDGYLYATVYNFNSGPSTEERISRIVKYSLPDLKQVDEFDIGYGTAESLAEYNNTYWVVYHDLNEIRQFDKDFNLIKSYPLSENFGNDGGYQGIFFDEDELYANLHGANKYGENYAQGLDHYHFNGREFRFIERIKPPTYGAGQGVEKVGKLYLWADRPGNSIIVTEKIKN
ncbi:MULTISPECIES: hypothetical protein [Paenibacillus]|uniref:hypothetical protein n=1 Tax=Paenibacillus TaxID=44249 RepID=UPI00287FD447|nr:MULTISPECIES: hypothetical protein [Paenibacillus]